MGLVTYSHYRFISAGNIHAIPHQDVTYLEAQGCLHVPITPVLNVFMSKYFAYIHLFLPLIDEGEFWDMYSQSSQSKNKISLFVLFAMLFASCNVSQPPAYFDITDGVPLTDLSVRSVCAY